MRKNKIVIGVAGEEFNVYELYFRRDGKKQAVICNSIREVGRRRRTLAKNRRKFLGYRPVKLVEVQ